MNKGDTILIEFQPEQVLILMQVLEQKMNANRDLRIKSAYMGILRTMQESVQGQVPEIGTHKGFSA